MRTLRAERVAFPALALMVCLAASPGVAADGPDDEPRDPPLVLAPFPMPDGTMVHRHLGLIRPSSAPDEAALPDWAVRSTKVGTYLGRRVVVYQYARPDGEGPGAPLKAAYAHADFVDPATGSIVGGADRRGDPWPADAPPMGDCGGR